MVRPQVTATACVVACLVAVRTPGAPRARRGSAMCAERLRCVRAVCRRAVWRSWQRRRAARPTSPTASSAAVGGGMAPAGTSWCATGSGHADRQGATPLGAKSPGATTLGSLCPMPTASPLCTWTMPRPLRRRGAARRCGSSCACSSTGSRRREIAAGTGQAGCGGTLRTQAAAGSRAGGSGITAAAVCGTMQPRSGESGRRQRQRKRQSRPLP